MTTINLTFSIPKEISAELHTYIKRRGMSKFVAQAIKKSLEEEKKKLRLEYQMANEDEGQREAQKDWEVTLLDGSDEW